MKTLRLHSFLKAFAVLLVLGARLASAQSQPIPNVTGNLKFMGFTLGKSTLEDVQARLGNSAVKKCSREEEASKEVCYVSGGKDRTKVVFEAGFSGGWKELDGFKVLSGVTTKRCYSLCLRTAQVTGNVQTEGGLKLGLTRKQLIAILGPPKQVRGNRLVFEWTTRQAMTNEQIEATRKTFKSSVTNPYYDVQDTIEVRLANSKVVEFEVHHIVTY